MGKFNKDIRMIKSVIKYCLEQEEKANKDGITEIGESYHDVIHYARDILNNNQ